MAVDGTYKIEMESPMGKMEITLTLKTDGDSLSGSSASQMGTTEFSGGKVNGDNFELESLKHVQLRKEIFLSNSKKPETYQIDIITEEYLPEFLDIIDNETEKIIKILKRKRTIVRDSVKRIIDEAKSLKKKPKSFRQIFEINKRG